MASAKDVLKALEALASPEDAESVSRFYTGGSPDNRILGVPIPKVFPVAKAHVDISLPEIEQLLENPHYEVRMAAVSIMDAKARQKHLSEVDRASLFKLYTRRHDRIDNWDLVDRAARFVVGEYLIDKDRGVLDKFARDGNPNARRTAVVACHAFLRHGETEDLFRIASILAEDLDT